VAATLSIAAISATGLSTENKSLREIFALSSNKPWYGMQILRDVESIDLAKLFTPRSGSIAHCRS
jgi:hypothetical protein